jgi:dTMP kinase
VRKSGYEVTVTREPGGVPVAERIRDVLLDTRSGSITPLAELLMMFAARAAHLEQLVRPALDSGRWVICDRFTDASYAYQGGGRGLPEAAIAQLETLVQGAFRPDLTILLDADWRETRERRAVRGIGDRFEAEDRIFFERVRAVYLDRASREPGRIRVVQAGAPLTKVQAELRGILTSFMRSADQKAL